jgi:hypothetical protein
MAHDGSCWASAVNAFTRFREEERVQHRHGTVELRLRRGTARDRKVDLAELPFLGSCERLGEKDRKRPDDNTA